MPKKYKTYTQEFKLKVLEAYKTHTCNEVSLMYDVSKAMIWKWRHDLKGVAKNTAAKIKQMGTSENTAVNESSDAVKPDACVQLSEDNRRLRGLLTEAEADRKALTHTIQLLCQKD